MISGCHSATLWINLAAATIRFISVFKTAKQTFFYLIDLVRSIQQAIQIWL